MKHQSYLKNQEITRIDEAIANQIKQAHQKELFQ